MILVKTKRRFKFSKIVEIIFFLSLLALTGYLLFGMGLIYEDGLNITYILMLIILLPMAFIIIFALIFDQRYHIDPVLTDEGEEPSGVSLIYFVPIYKKCKKYR
jgi:hypothetical protein